MISWWVITFVCWMMGLRLSVGFDVFALLGGFALSYSWVLAGISFVASFAVAWTVCGCLIAGL